MHPTRAICVNYWCDVTYLFGKFSSLTSSVYIDNSRLVSFESVRLNLSRPDSLNEGASGLLPIFPVLFPFKNSFKEDRTPFRKASM